VRPCDDVAVNRVIQLPAQLALIAIPVVGWFAQDWSGATTLAVYWFETVAACLFIAARVLLQQRWAPRHGHFQYDAPSTDRRSGSTSSFVSGFLVVTMAFSAAHAVFLGVILLLLSHNGKAGFAVVDWRSVALGCLGVVAFLALDFLVDLSTLRRWSFWQMERLANRGLSRVIVVHLTLIFGFVAIAVTDAPDAFFGVFVVLKTMAALSSAFPQWEPAAPPRWLSRLMNRMPNVHPGERFEDFWAKDRADEAARREKNERPWSSARAKP
jgi:hypothetical protein